MSVVGILLIIMAWYTFLALQAARGWRIAAKHSDSSDAMSPFSLLVPFRNEAEHLPRMLQQIADNGSLADGIEVIFIDDASNDKGGQLITDAMLGEKVRLIQAEGQGKKAAISAGLNAARNEIIVTTDCDVAFHKNWINAIAKEAATMIGEMKILPVVPSKPSGFVQRFATMDYLALLGSTMSSVALGQPIMASGANLMFKRTVYTQHNHDKASGDDMFLLHQIKQEMGKIFYSLNQDTAVKVQMPQTLSGFISQRQRWTGKATSYKDPFTTLVAWIVLLFNLLQLVVLVLAVLGIMRVEYFVLIFGLKFILDLLLLIPVHRTLERASELWFYPIAALIYPIYVPSIFLISLFGSFDWKGRTHRK